MSVRVSVVATVLNEASSIQGLLDGLLAQTRPADEVILVDGGSTDGTPTVLARYASRLPLRVLTVPGANISAGRNVGIAAAAHDIVAVTDAGTRLAPDWLAQLVAPFARPGAPVMGVAGFFLPDPRTTFEAALAATVLPALTDVHPARFLPSSRSVAFRKAAWARVGGYPEWLDYCEDLVFDLRVQALCGPFVFAPGALVYFRPRTSLRAFALQYYRYARGDGKADLWRKRHVVRYVIYLLALPTLLAGVWRGQPFARALLAAGAFFYLRGPYRRLPSTMGALARWRGHSIAPHEALLAVALVPLLRAVGDAAKMLGYPVGWMWRLRQRPPDWLPPGER